MRFAGPQCQPNKFIGFLRQRSAHTENASNMSAFETLGAFHY
jgi:hypothetical protein